MLLFIGSYTDGKLAKGIHVFGFQETDGKVDFKCSLQGVNPSYLGYDDDRQMLYAINEIGGDKGRISAFKIGVAEKQFESHSPKPTYGGHPCHLSLDPRGRFVAVSNYFGGGLCLYAIEEDGGIGGLLEVVEHKGEGPVKARQEASHIHSAIFSTDRTALFVQDLGADCVYVYQVLRNGNGGFSALEPQQRLHFNPGSGPRHAAFAPSGNYCYVVCELNASIAVLKKQQSQWQIIQEVQMASDDPSDDKGASDVKISSCGGYLYAAVRGISNVIVTFSIDGYTGMIVELARQSSLGVCPRNLSLSPAGKYLLMTNQRSNEVTVFGRNDNGLYDPINHIKVKSPSCVIFGQVKILR